MTRKQRIYHSIRLFLIRSVSKRTAYVKKHHIFAEMGENCRWGPWHLPLYSELIKLHNNVAVHKRAVLVPHDMLNGFLMKCAPETDFGSRERLGCIEIMDNVYISMNVVVMPNVRIGKNCIISAGSVVATDIPENSIASGVPAKVTGRFDMFLAMRKLQAKQNPKFKNQDLPAELAAAEWEKFYKRHDKA